MTENKFIKQTLQGLEIKEENYCRLSHKGFNFDESNTREEECVLVIGLNPAGDKKDVDREKEGKTYLYSIDQKIINNGHIYNKYFLPIYKFVNQIFKDEAMWPWCSKKWDKLEIDPEILDIVEKEYNNHQNRKYTIYIGDMFYYHETSSGKLPYKFDKECDFSSYCHEMLRLHIETLKNAGKNIKFIYINNAKVSHWLCGDMKKTFDEIENVKVFYGSMLSGQRSMDVFSRLRLIDEIQENLI